PGSAAQGADFLPLSTPLTFADGDNATQTLSLGIIDDNVREESETLWLRIRDGASAQILAETEVTLTDNDISDLALAVTRQPQGPTTTSALSYLFSVSNTDSTQSGVSVQAVVLTVTLSRPAGGVSAQIEGGSCDVGDQIVCSLGLLAANSTRNVTLNFAQPGYGPLVMSASLSGTGSDSAPANSSIGDLTQVQLSFDAAQYFPLDVGAQWVYSTDFGNTSITVSRLAGTFAINGHQAVALQFAEPGSQPGVPYLATNFYTLDGNGLRLVRQQDDELRLTYNPPLPLLPANGLTGTTLQGSGTLEIASASGNSFAVLGTVPYTSAAQVIVQEQVETPSGTYDALKVEVAQAASGTLPVVGAIDVSATDSYWLARDAGAVLLDLDQPDGPPRALTLTSLTLDGDLDGINRPQDNCPELANANQDDFDHDGLGDACDADDDNDGVPDTSDAFPANAAESTDTDNDGVGNNADEDDDGDGLPDSIETANGLNPLNGDDGAGDADGDGLSNVAEYLAGTAINDSDSDHDGVSDSVEIARGRNPLLNEGAVINIILQSLL
ncbi:MAG: thrombospondin type 3 repeat-containing protein, partial [Gammaproteobacteria bacterium]|nr:thrombospondin type 3 repeat-containing protein [Gammaproteobacteria bacterium]